MYNGVGVTTTRGTGTSGHVQRNIAALRGPHRRPGTHSNNSNPAQLVRRKLGETRAGAKAILAHEKLRGIEVAVAELEEELTARGYDEATIATMTGRLREDLLERDAQEEKAKGLDKEQERGEQDGKELGTSEAAEMADIRNDKLKSAFGMPDDYEEGAGFKRMRKEGNGDGPQLEKKANGGAPIADGPVEETHAKPGPGTPPSSPSSSSSVLSSSSSEETGLPKTITRPLPDEGSASAVAEDSRKKRNRGGDILLEESLMKRAKTTPPTPAVSDGSKDGDASSIAPKEMNAESRSNSPISSRDSSSHSRRSRSSLDDSRDRRQYGRVRSASPGDSRASLDAKREYRHRGRSRSLVRSYGSPEPHRERRSRRRYDSLSPSSSSWSSRSPSPRRRRSSSPYRRRRASDRRVSDSYRKRHYRARSPSLSPSYDDGYDSYEGRRTARHRRDSRYRDRYYSPRRSRSSPHRGRGSRATQGPSFRHRNSERSPSRPSRHYDSTDSERDYPRREPYYGRREYRGDDRGASPPPRYQSSDYSRDRYPGEAVRSNHDDAMRPSRDESPRRRYRSRSPPSRRYH